MTVITIREQSQTDTGFNAILVIEGNNYPITVSDPFTEKQEQELEWYFEDWLRYPMLDNVKANRAKISVNKYGEELFKQVFQLNIDAYSKYSQIRNNLNQVQIEIESITPEFHAIHWEALQDPELPHPLAVNSVFMRKSVESVDIAANIKESPTINLLVVVARPKSDRDIPHRTISRPLVEAIRNAKLRVNIEILRPGTYEALAKHLEAKEKGYYHIVHFDVHGALKTYEDYQKGIKDNLYLQPRYGRKEIKPYKGVKAFLALEGNEPGEYDPVEASEIADLLTEKGIPVCILNACQSGKQLKSPLATLDKVGIEDNRETSLGSRLMNAGIQMVVAMSYSVTVTAAEIIMQQIYQHLFDNQDINQAIRLGRKELYNRKARKAAYNTAIDLEDWLLPVVYCNGEVTFNLREFTTEEKAQYDLNLESKYEFTQPTYGFVGRDIDILLIEKALLQHNILLLQGMGGTGKSTLLNYLREWWQVTIFAEDVLYFDYDEKAYNLQQIVFEISKQIYNQFDFERFQKAKNNINEQWQKLSNKLRRESYILILDNLESISGKTLAIENTLEELDREEIKEFLASLVGSKTKVVLGSRIAEEWLRESTFKDNSYQLRGLDIQARTDLVENILQRVNSSKSIDEIKTDEHFQRLMKLLAGYPLAMGVVLSNLKNQSPQEILENLEKAKIDPGGEYKENNLIKCIDYSYSNLSESAQKLLLLLAPFRSFINIGVIPNYIEELKKIEQFEDYDLDQLETAINESINWGLLTPINQDLSKYLIIQPILPCFLQIKLKKADEEMGEYIRESFKNYYQKLAFFLYRLLISKDSQERQMGKVFIQREYENLYQALQICLKKQEKVILIWMCLYNYLGLSKNQLTQLRLAQNICEKLKVYELKKRNIYQEDIINIFTSLGNCYLDNKDYKASKNIYQSILDLILENNNLKTTKKQKYIAIIYYQFGRVFYESKEYKEARKYYQQVLDLFSDETSRNNNSILLAHTYDELGLLSEQLKQFDKAKNYHEQALPIWIEYGYLDKQSRIYQQFAIIAQELRQYQQAEEYYQQALDIFLEYGDLYNQAKTYYNLGTLSEKLSQHQEAQKYYIKALAIQIKNGDRYNQAKIYLGLGNIAYKACQYQQAQEYYQQALDIFLQYDDYYHQTFVYFNLGNVAKDLSRHREAQNYYQKALAISVEYGDQYSQAIIYQGFGEVVGILRQYQKAQEHYTKALAIQIENGDHYNQAKTYLGLGNITCKSKKYQQAQKHYQKALDIYIEEDDKNSQVNMHLLFGKLAEDLSEFEQAKNYYLQALGIFSEFEDQQSLDLTTRNLANLYQQTEDNSLITEVASMFNVTEAEVRELFDRFKQLED